MSDYQPQRKDKITQYIDIPDSTDARVVQDIKEKENAGIVDFATKIADKYGKSNRSKDLIKKSIVNCYNQAVVDHNSPSELKFPNDQYWVTSDANGNIIPDDPRKPL